GAATAKPGAVVRGPTAAEQPGDPAAGPGPRRPPQETGEAVPRDRGEPASQRRAAHDDLAVPERRETRRQLRSPERGPSGVVAAVRLAEPLLVEPAAVAVVPLDAERAILEPGPGWAPPGHDLPRLEEPLPAPRLPALAAGAEVAEREGVQLRGPPVAELDAHDVAAQLDGRDLEVGRGAHAANLARATIDTRSTIRTIANITMSSV